MEGLLKKIGVGIVLFGLTILSSGCGGKLQTKSSIPNLPSGDNPFYALARIQYDSKLDRAKHLRAEGYRTDRLIVPSNDSVPGYSGGEPGL